MTLPALLNLVGVKTHASLDFLWLCGALMTTDEYHSQCDDTTLSLFCHFTVSCNEQIHTLFIPAVKMQTNI